MTAWVVDTLVALTLLMIVILAVRRPVASLFGAGWAYALWAVPALRLLLPPLPILSPDLGLPAAAIIPAAGGAAAPLVAAGGLELWTPSLLVTWLAGAAIFLLLHILSYRAFVGRVDASSRPACPPLYGGIDTVESAAVDGPVAVGVLTRRIVVPADFAMRYSACERRLAMEHELVHHRRRDIWWNIAALIVLALNWFNPIAWLAHRAFRTDQELACDAAVAARSSLPERRDYANALVKSASRPGLVAACPLNRADQLKRRLRMMAQHRVSLPRTLGGVVATATLAAAGLVSAATPAPAPVAPKAQVEVAIGPVAAVASALPSLPAAEPTPAPRAHRRSPAAAPAAVRTPVAPLASPVPIAASAPSTPVPPVQRPLRVVVHSVSAVSPAEVPLGGTRTIVIRHAKAGGPNVDIGRALEQALAELESADIDIDLAHVQASLRREIARVRVKPMPAARPIS